MGLGVVKSTVGVTKFKVMALVAGLFFVDIGLEVLEVLRNFFPLNKPSQLSDFLVGAPFAVLNTAFIWWMFVSLQRTRQQLILRRQTLKSELYRTFFNFLIAVAVVSALSALYQIWLNAIATDDQWTMRWIWAAFWGFLFFLVLAVVAFLWRPRKNNTRYGYSDTGMDDEDDTILQLPSLASGLSRIFVISALQCLTSVWLICS